MTQEESDYFDVCNLRYILDQRDKIFTDEQLLIIVKNKEEVVKTLTQFEEY